MFHSGLCLPTFLWGTSTVWEIHWFHSIDEAHLIRTSLTLDLVSYLCLPLHFSSDQEDGRPWLEKITPEGEMHCFPKGRLWSALPSRWDDWVLGWQGAEVGRCWTLGSSRSPLAGRCLFRSNSGSQAQRHILLIAALRRQAQRHVAQLGYVARLLKKTKEWKITHERNRLKLINLFILFSLLILLANRYFNRSPQHNPVVLNRGSGDQHPLIPSPHPPWALGSRYFLVTILLGSSGTVLDIEFRQCLLWMTKFLIKCLP